MTTTRLLLRAMSNSDPNVFYSLTVTGRLVSEGGKGIKLKCTCKGYVQHGAHCIHLQVMLHCARKDCLPYGYFETPEGIKFLKLSRGFKRVDLEETVKEVRALSKERKQKRAIEKVESIKRNVAARTVGADQSVEYLLDKAVDMIQAQKKRQAGRILLDNRTYRLFVLQTGGYRLEGGEDVVDVDVQRSCIHVFKIIGPRNWGRVATYPVKNMSGFLRENGGNLALNLFDLV